MKFWAYGQSKVFAVQWIEEKYQGTGDNTSLFSLFLPFSIFLLQIFWISANHIKIYLSLLPVSSQKRYFPHSYRKKNRNSIDCDFLPSTWKLHRLGRKIGFGDRIIRIWILTLLQTECLIVGKCFGLCIPFRIIVRIKWN